jgi:hypothetical protein
MWLALTSLILAAAIGVNVLAVSKSDFDQSRRAERE